MTRSTSFYEYHKVIYAGGATGTASKPGDVRTDTEAFKDAEALGRRIAELT
ncbi:MAG: hypothetical protein QW587_04190 [Candidatus Bathyarchaeia archaeon]